MCICTHATYVTHNQHKILDVLFLIHILFLLCICTHAAHVTHNQRKILDVLFLIYILFLMCICAHAAHVTRNQHKMLDVQNVNTLALAVCNRNLTSPIKHADAQFPKTVVDVPLCALMLLSLLLICQSPHSFLIVYLLFP